jgi:uridine kinase
VEIPTYDFTTHKRCKETIKIVAAPIKLVIFEGILSLYDPRIRSLMNLKIFVLTDDDIRLARRLTRDIKERGRTVHDVLV